MKELFKVIGFSLLVMGGYTYFSNSIPQIRGEPPAELSITGPMTMEEFIEYGKNVFGTEDNPGKGTCPLCHKRIGGRAPLLDGVAFRAEERIKDPRYKGKAKNAEEYIRESEMCPSCYVVEGYGKPGTNDTVSPMPKTNRPPIGLAPVEINSVIAFFQSRDGAPITVSPPTAAVIAAAEGVEVGEVEEKVQPIAASPEEAIKKFRCGSCHQVAGEKGEGGPDLTRIGDKAKGKDAYLIQSILNPDHNKNERLEGMTVQELNIIIKYLMEQKG